MKYSKKDVKYTEGHGDSDEWCARCRFFIQRMSMCKVVKGTINSQGWCMKFLAFIGAKP